MRPRHSRASTPPFRFRVSARPSPLLRQMMKRTACLLLVFLVVASATSRSRDLQGLFHWNLTLTSIEAHFGFKQPNQFTFTYANGDSLTDATNVVETILDPTCTNEDDVGGLIASESAVNGLATTSTVNVAFDALGTAVWSIIDEITGQLQFCYRTQVHEQNAQMNYVNTVVTVTVNLLNTIATVTNMIAIQGGPFGTSGDIAIDINYPLVIYMCDADNVPLDPVPVIAPGGSVRTCINLPSTVAGVALASIYDAKLVQQSTGVESVSIVTGVTQNSFTSGSCPTGVFCVLETTVPGDFFLNSTQGISLEGSCIMAIGRRMVEVRLPFARKRQMEEATPKGTFQLPFLVDGTLDAVGGAAAAGKLANGKHRSGSSPCNNKSGRVLIVIATVIAVAATIF